MKKEWLRDKELNNFKQRVILIFIYLIFLFFNYNIRCTTLLPPFFFRNRGFIVKNWLYIYDSKHRWPLLSPIFRIAYEFRVEKTGLLRLSTNRSNFLLLHKTGSVGQSGRVPLIETSDSQREQRLENTTGGVGLPISTFPSKSWPLSQRGVEHCHAAKSIVSLVVLRPFVFQCSAQTHQLHSIPIACDCFSRF